MNQLRVHVEEKSEIGFKERQAFPDDDIFQKALIQLSQLWC